jgi:hypothetical protein
MSFAIRTAIFFRAGLSVIHRFFKRIFNPVFKGISSRLHLSKSGSGRSRPVKTAIVSDTEGYRKVTEFLLSAGIPAETVMIGTGMNDTDKNNYVNINNINDILKEHRISQVIFTAGRMSASLIIDSMYKISDRRVTIRISSADERFIIGSGSVNTQDPKVSQSNVKHKVYE